MQNFFLETLDNLLKVWYYVSVPRGTEKLQSLPLRARVADLLKIRVKSTNVTIDTTSQERRKI